MGLISISYSNYNAESRVIRVRKRDFSIAKSVCICEIRNEFAP
jgi:hypothetical protein